MKQILFEMYIGVITNFRKEPDYGHQIPHPAPAMMTTTVIRPKRMR